MATLVGKPAPKFKTQAIVKGAIKEVSMDEYKGKWVVLFFYPLDFTFVCPSELLAFHNRVKDFASRKTQVVGCSVDSHFTHLAWTNTPVAQGGVGKLGYPLVADLNKNIARNYDVLLNESVALRGTFLIDEQGVVRHQLVNDLPLGRNIDETIRMIDALDFHKQHGEVCPAGWTKGKPGMKASAEGVATYLAANAKSL